MASEREAFDQQLTRKLEEIAALVQQIESKDFKDALKKMREALEKMDRRELEHSIPQWRQQNQELMKNLERTAELLKQLRQEEKLSSLAQRAEEQKAAQDLLNHALEQPKATEDPAEQQPVDEAAETLEQEAAPQQHQASQASPGDPNQAAQSGQKASESLGRAAQKLRQALERRQQGREGVDLAAVRRAAQDLVSIQRESQQNMASGDPPSERSNRQSDLSEGVARVADSLQTLSKSSPFIKPKLSESLGRAMGQLANSSKMLDQGNRPGGEQAGKSAGQALNEAVAELRAAEGAMCNKPGGSKPGSQRSGQKLSELSGEQGRLNQRSRRLTQQMSEQMRLSAGDQAEMRRLADQRSLNRQDFDPQRESRPGEDVARRSPAELQPELLRETDRLRLDLLKAEADCYPAQYRAFIESYLRSLNGSPR